MIHLSTRLLSAQACLALAFLTSCSARKTESAGPPPPAPVAVAVAARESVPVELRAVGSVEPSATVQVKSQIAGELMSVHFAEGGEVKQGDLLFTIDPRPYREALLQAEAALSRDAAQVHQAEAAVARDRAQAKSADADAARNDELAHDGIVAKSVNDQARATADALHESTRADQAAIESARAAVESDKAAIDKAKLDLSYCEIRSPLTGRVGNLLVQQGNLIKVSDAALVVINRLSPIWVTFAVPQQYLPAIRANSARHPLPVQALFQNDAAKPASGELIVIDNAVDTNTGTIRLKANFANAERLLWPGQFVNVVLTLDTHDSTVIPSEAVQAGQQGPMVYVVKSDQSVEPRLVSVGAAFGHKVVIEKGVSPGETVVTDGQLRLFPGARVKPVPAGQSRSPGAVMNISRLFIERPIMTTLVMCAILLFGIVAYRALPVAALPSVDYPSIQVTASLPGANPETMASAVATPLERQFATIAGIESMSSTNSQGVTQINLQFALDRNIDAAAQDVQAAISKAGGQLPPTMPRPPSFQKQNPSEQPVLYLSLTSDTLPLYTVDEYAETLLAQRISMSSGVSSVQVYGAQKYAVRVQLDPDALAARGIGIDEVERRRRTEQYQPAHGQALRRSTGIYRSIHRPAH